MPTKRVVKRKVGKKRKQQGAGIFDSIKKAILSAAGFAKKHKILSRSAAILNKVGVPYSGVVGNIASNLGYGKRKTGTGLLMAGQKYVKKGTGMKKPKAVPKRKTALRVKHSFP
jgi:hypothetical protein